MEANASGEVSKKGIKKVMDSLGLYNHDGHLKSEWYTFDHFLSIIGEIEMPMESSVYVISFVKVLSNYRDKCLRSDEEGLYEAK
jgi:hypothetical protein